MNIIFDKVLKLAITYFANHKIKKTDLKFTSADIDKVAGWVIDQSKEENKHGWEKAEEVLKQFNATWGARLSWAAKTAVQLCYAFVMIKGAIK
jgi:hypothetical protein